MIQNNWNNQESKRTVTCQTNVAAKYKVDTMLTVGQKYEVVNETDEFIFVIDNSNRIAGYFKHYFD